MTKPSSPETPPSFAKSRNVALGLAAAFFVSLAAGTNLLGIDAHAPFLFGLGNLPTDFVEQLPWVAHAEPVNALTIPTWAIHFSSVFEYLFAMNLIWRYSETTNNPAWKGMTWGMLPLHASGMCACTYHFFYNPSTLQFLVSMQAGLTLLGNLTCALAAYRIAKSNGWTLDEVNPFPKSPTNPTGLVADGIAAMPLNVDESKSESSQVLAAKLIGLTLFASYLVKYGELGLDVPFTPNAPVALAIVLGIPAITAFQYYSLSEKEGGGENDRGFSLFNFGNKEDGDGNPLSMADIKKYGVAGTVAYVLTELAFWIVAFPVAAYALYQSTGHWPDVIHENADRAAVLAFIFAGANVARAFVPVRLGAALALAPWVDENILSKMGGSDSGSNSDGSTPSQATAQSSSNQESSSGETVMATPFYMNTMDMETKK